MYNRQLNKIAGLIRKFSLFFIAHCSLLIAQNKLDVIVIDAGHGGKDPGTIGDNTGVQEKNIVLPISMKLGALIEKKFPAIKIIFTRVTDDFIDLKERTKLANDSKAKLFISIHANHKKQEESEKNGFEIYFLNQERMQEAILITMKENKNITYKQSGNDTTGLFIFSTLAQAGYKKFSELLATGIEMSMVNQSKLASRGIMEAGFWVILGASMPAVLVETGYLSDINDENYLSSEKGQSDIAFSLFNAFQNFKLAYESQ